MVFLDRARSCHDHGEGANTLPRDSGGDRHERCCIHDSFTIVAAYAAFCIERVRRANFVLPILAGTQVYQNLHSIRKIDGARRNRIGFTFPELYGEIFWEREGRDENEEQNQWSYHSQRRVRCVSVGGLYRV